MKSPEEETTRHPGRHVAGDIVHHLGCIGGPFGNLVIVDTAIENLILTRRGQHLGPGIPHIRSPSIAKRFLDARMKLFGVNGLRFRLLRG